MICLIMSKQLQVTMSKTLYSNPLNMHITTASYYMIRSQDADSSELYVLGRSLGSLGSRLLKARRRTTPLDLGWRSGGSSLS